MAEPSQRSTDSIWPLKEITFPPGSNMRYKTISQNKNGPCGLIALCNVLILRGHIQIQPAGRTSVAYEYLAGLIADYLVNSGTTPSEDLSHALSCLPKTQHGMDLNPVFTEISSFQQADRAGELALFELCGVRLVHGWLADPHGPEYAVLEKCGDYDSALDAIVAAEESDSGDDKVAEALIIRQFIETNSTQLTYHGLFTLAALDEGLYCLIRNSHLSVLYKQSPASLWTLVTDASFAREPAVVWESLEDVDGSGSRFVDGDLIPSSTAGGDFAGRTAEHALRDAERAAGVGVYDADFALAQQLQAEEDDLVRQTRQLNINQSTRDPHSPARTPPTHTPTGQAPPRKKASTVKDKEKKDCIIQ